MKCMACGREMLDRGTHYECSNILCDYEEDIIETKGEWERLKGGLPILMGDHLISSSSLTC